MKIGYTNSFKVELFSLREGIQLIKERWFIKVDIEMDSEVVVKVITNGSRLEFGASTLLADCK